MAECSKCPEASGLQKASGDDDKDYTDLQNEILAAFAQRKKWLKDNKTWERLDYRLKRDQLFQRFEKEKEERMMQECMCKAEKDKCHRQRQIVQEENFAEAMMILKEDDIRESAFRKQLYACAPEIRDLEREIRRAYYAKTLHAQRLEQQSRILEEKMREHEMYELFQETLSKFDEAEAEKERNRLRMACDYRLELEEQINSVNAATSIKKEETEHDREMVDEVLRTIQQEEYDDLMEKINKVKLYQSEINNFLEARENSRKREKARQEMEEVRDKEYKETKEVEKAAYNKAREDRDKAKAAIIAKAVQQMMEAQFQREELEDLRMELTEEEANENFRQREAAEIENKCRAKKELQEAEAEAKRLQAEKLATEKEEDEKFKEGILKKFAEDDRLEQLGKSKRQQREREHRKKVEEMIIQRRATRAQEREQELQLRFCTDDENKRREDLINLERKKLLQEHGPNLLGFITRGTIKDQAELDRLGEPFINYYRNGSAFRQPDPSTIDSSPCEEELFKNMEVPRNAKY